MKHLFDEWPYDPLPDPVHYSNGGTPCNAPYRINGVLVGHCCIIVPARKKHRGHRGKHRIEWSAEEPNLYDVARKVTDEVLGEGTYAGLNSGNPDPNVQAAIERGKNP